MAILDLLLDLAEVPPARIPDHSRAMARLSLFDWMVCGLAAVDEPVAQGLRIHVQAEGGHPMASVMGGLQAPARAAALVNGTTSHALDYDDTHFAHIGHLSVAIYPAALAAGEEAGASAAQVIDAFLLGAEAAIRVGLLLGRGHYDRGFHQTATAGAFGATVAAGRLYGLDRARMCAALGLCATRASGLKCQFGTMGKPLNAGYAAANGVECAGLARAGLRSADDGLEGPQGFVATHSDAPDPQAATVPVGTWLFDDIKHKLHACCHGTHAMIEALQAVLRDRAMAPDQVAEIRIRTHPRWLSVCDIRRPRTGLEVKFSYVWLAAMVLDGRSTARDRSFDDACAADPVLAGIAARIVVAGDAGLSDMQVGGDIVLTDGTRLPLSHDLAARVPPDLLGQSLRTKGAALLGARTGALWQAVQGPDGLAARELGALLRS